MADVRRPKVVYGAAIGLAVATWLTGVAVVRVPFGRSNYGALLSASTNGQVGLGISLLNISLLPVIP